MSEVCYKCGRFARWFWPGNNYEPPKFCCGYHKRTFIHVVRWNP